MRYRVSAKFGSTVRGGYFKTPEDAWAKAKAYIEAGARLIEVAYV